MAKAKHPFLRLFFLSVLLFGIPIAVAPFVPLDTLKPDVEARLSHLLGRQVTVGSMRLSLLGGPYLYINQMVAKEDPAFGDGDFLRANQVRADFSIWSYLLRRRVEIESLRIQSPDLTLVKNPDGIWNWATFGKPETTAKNAAKNTAAQLSGGRHLQTVSTALLGFVFQGITDTNIKKIWIEQASVRIVDKVTASEHETLYRNVNLQSDIDRQPAGSRVTGRMSAHSDEGDGAEVLKMEMPFALTLAGDGQQTAQGKLGPGQIESKNFSAENFTADLDVKEGAVTLNQMEMALYDGALRGNLQLNLATQQFTAEGEVENLDLDEALASKVQMPGQITGHINAKFKLSGVLGAFQQTVPTIFGDGRVTSSGLYIASVNVSEQVARALKLNQIGDMSQGTRVGALEADFHIEQGVVSTSNLQIQQLDGLGDATADRGWLRVEAAPTFHYAVSVLLSSDATTQVKNTSPIVGAAVSVLEVNNRVSVPVDITGEVRNPQVAVDVRKLILGF